MKPNIRLLALDLDGTLLNEEKHITPRTLAALERAREQGVLLVPVTGRPAQGLPQAVLDLPGLRYAVTSNGPPSGTCRRTAFCWKSTSPRPPAWPCWRGARTST